MRLILWVHNRNLTLNLDRIFEFNDTNIIKKENNWKIFYKPIL